MCGIAGQVALDRDAAGAVDPAATRAMVAAIRHRGPDHQGFLDAPGVSLGMARLSIIDLSSGDQPIGNEDGSIQVVYNGELYNFRELRRELEAAGHRFSTRSDTECIVHGYEEWGAAVADRLRGMFAFALWDAPRRRLVIARDRLGEKPLYWTTDRGLFWFASELKALPIERPIDLAALDEYLSYGFIGAPRTIRQGVRKLPPGSLLIVEDGRVSERRYWLPALAPRPPVSFDAAVEELRPLLQDAVASQLVSDAPLGAFLSGGLDSSVVVALMARASPQPVRTFCVGFEEAGFDERPHARRVAEHLGTRHEEHVVRPDVAAILPELVDHFDEPFGDKSLVPTFFVAEMARRHVKVCLSGDGGDEVFGGYVSYTTALAQRKQAAARPPIVRRLLRRGAALYPAALPQSFRVRKRALGERERFLAASLQFDPDARRDLLSAEARAAMNGDPLAPKRPFLDEAERLDFLGALQWNDLRHYLPGDILVKVDRMTMKNSLESRAPFLDHRVVERMLGMPDEYKIHGGETKRLLRAIAAELLPPEILARPKQGFALPVSAWLARDLKEMCADVLGGAALRESGWFKPAALARIAEGVARAQAAPGNRAWLLLCLGLWLERSGRSVGGAA